MTEMVVYLVAYGYKNPYAGSAVNPNKQGSCEVILRASTVLSRDKFVDAINGVKMNTSLYGLQIHPSPFSWQELRRFVVEPQNIRFSFDGERFEIDAVEVLEKRRIIFPSLDILLPRFDPGEELKDLKSIGKNYRSWFSGVDEEDHNGKKKSLRQLAKKYKAVPAIPVKKAKEQKV